MVNLKKEVRSSECYAVYMCCVYLSHFGEAVSGQREKEGVLAQPGLRGLRQVAVSGLLEQQRTPNVRVVVGQVHELMSGLEIERVGTQRLGAQEGGACRELHALAHVDEQLHGLVHVLGVVGLEEHEVGGGS